MRKVLTVAARDYLATVRSRYFIFCVLLVPLLMSLSAVVSRHVGTKSKLKEKRFAVVDRTPRGEFFPLLEKAVRQRNETQLNDSKTGEQYKPVFVIERVEPSADTPEAIGNQRLELSERVRKEQLAGFLEIGPDVATGQTATGERAGLRYQSDNVTAEGRFDAFPRWAERVVNEAIRQHRIAAAGLSVAQVQAVLQPVPLVSQTLSRRNPTTEAIEETSEGSVLARVGAMMSLVMLMYMGIVFCASFLIQAVLEEKMQRIAEILLGSVPPFQLMMGKLFGLGSASLTITALYFGGLYWAARLFGWTEYLPPLEVVPWFVVFFVLAMLLYGSVAMALGAASTDIKEVNMLFTPVLMVVILPLLLLPLVQDDPNGPLAVGFSLFPPTAPTFMMARMAIPPGIPAWQLAVGVGLLLVTTFGCVWGAGRVFRVGILMHGKGAGFGEMAKWLVRG
jgi:ABC-2 type transport system permease protein